MDLQKLNPQNRKGEKSSIDGIFVPRGAEYRAICRGMPKKAVKTQIIPIPMGYQPSSRYLKQWIQSTNFLNKSPQKMLLMGLGGGLSPTYQIGDIIIYQGCGYRDGKGQLLWRNCDPILTEVLYQKLQGNRRVFLVKGLTSDRIICTAQEKAIIYQQYGLDVVDMEGFSALELLDEKQISVAIIRVISDDYKQNLPNINSAIDSQGNLQYIPLTSKILSNPQKAIALIRGSLNGLKILQAVTNQLLI